MYILYFGIMKGNIDMPNKFKAPSYKRLTSAINQRNQGSCKNRRKKIYTLVGKVFHYTCGYIFYIDRPHLKVRFHYLDKKPVLRMRQTFEWIKDNKLEVKYFGPDNIKSEISQTFVDNRLVSAEYSWGYKEEWSRNDKGLITSFRNSNKVFQEYLNPDFSYETKLIYERTHDLNKYRIDGDGYSREEALKYLEDIITDETKIEEHEKAKHLHNLITAHTPMIVE